MSLYSMFLQAEDPGALWNSIRILDLKIFLVFSHLARILHFSKTADLMSDPWFYTPLFAFIGVFLFTTDLHRKRYIWAFFFSFAALFIAIQLSELLSYFIRQPSPDAWMARSYGGAYPANIYSLPDRMMAALSAFLFFILSNMPARKLWLNALCWVVVMPLFAMSRIAAGDAFPTHLILGFITGALVAGTFMVFFRNFRKVILHEDVR